MATPITQMRIPTDKKKAMQKAAKHQGYASLTAYLVAAGMEKAAKK